MKRVVALAGGVGGAKLVDGLASILPTEAFSVIVNTGDDFEMFGLKICPDIDTVCYTLADLANPSTGWGRENETWNCLNSLKLLDAPTWFSLGDNDLALHLERTRLIHEGLPLSEITGQLCKKMNIQVPVFPMTDDIVSTIITTKEFGDLPFQEYFVKHHFEPTMTAYRFDGSEEANAPKKVISLLEAADIVIICPSNPWVSIKPILSIRDIYNQLKNKVCIAVSPIIGGNALKGPAAKMYREMGLDSSALEVARQYKDLVTGFVLDVQDREQSNKIRQWGIIPLETNIMMVDEKDRIRLAQEVLEFSLQIEK